MISKQTLTLSRKSESTLIEVVDLCKWLKKIGADVNKQSDKPQLKLLVHVLSNT